MNPSERIAREFIRLAVEPICTTRPSVWCEENLMFNEPNIKGRMNFSGREYLRDCVDDVASDCTDFVYPFGTGVGKTITFIAQAAFEMATNPSRCLWVFPGSDGPGGAGSFVKTRLLPALRATPWTRDRMPTGADRFDVTSSSIRMCGTVLDFVGSNSPAQVAANRCSRVRQDEVDKFAKESEQEASATYNADRRTDGVEGAKRFKASSPTLENGLIWQEFLKSDQQRRFLPCPHCEKFLVLAWSKQFTCFKLRGDEAFVKWDDTAKGSDGEWNYDAVKSSAHFVCPHCAGKIFDSHKFDMDKRGEWRPTAKGFPKYRGRHLPSMYASSSECRVGELAVEFLKCLASGDIKGFINSRLAEVDMAQQHSSRIEINSKPIAQPDWVALLTADFHKNAPYIWFVVRKWCAFKLLPPFQIENGMPIINGIVLPEILDQPGNELAKNNCEILVGKLPAAWNVIGELMRFDSQTGQSPIIDFLLAKKITGEKLVKLFLDDASGDTMKFRKLILKKMGFERPNRGGDSELLAAGNLETTGPQLWDDLRDIEKEFKVGHGLPPHRRCTLIDSGYAEQFDREVLQMCYDRAEFFQWYDPTSPKNAPQFHGFWRKGEDPSHKRHPFCQPCPVDGWLPIRGTPTNRPLGDGKTARDIGTRIDDPFYGTPEAGQRVIEVLSVPQGLFWFRRQNLLQRRTKNVYGISPNVSLFPKNYGPDGTRMDESRFRLDDYQRQLNIQFYNEQTKKVEPRGGRGGSQSRRNPYHLDDCETYQVALATHLEFFEV